MSKEEFKRIFDNSFMGLIVIVLCFIMSIVSEKLKHTFVPYIFLSMILLMIGVYFFSYNRKSGEKVK